MSKVHKIQKILIQTLILILRKTHHFKKASCLRYSKDQTNHFFQEPKELGDLINKGNFIHKYLPKRMDIDKILEIIQRKVLKGTHLLIKIKEIQPGCLCSPYFKIYICICHKTNFHLLNQQSEK